MATAIRGVSLIAVIVKFVLILVTVVTVIVILLVMKAVISMIRVRVWMLQLFTVGKKLYVVIYIYIALTMMPIVRLLVGGGTLNPRL